MKSKATRLYVGQNPGYLADNLAKCSCWMCSYGMVKSHQEVKVLRAEKVDINE